MSRHRSRYRAVQILYQVDMRDLAPEEAINSYYDTLYSEEHEERPERDEFMEQLVHGAFEQRASIDERIEKHSANWKLERMPAVDRNLLRMAVFEITTGTAPAIVIDEAVELAKRLSGEDSMAFVNGVLDAVARDTGAAAAKE